MRADSIRDRYAKGLALFGLGLLAGTGALVDYWPTRGHLPLVAPVDREDLHLAAARPRDPLTIVVAPPTTARRAPPSRPAEPVPQLQLGAAPSVRGLPVALMAPAAPAATDPEVAPVAVLASAAAASSVTASLILPPLATPRYTASWSADSEEGGFLTGTVKRTGASILRTSARAGVSVFDAFRSLGGAVKRALPN